MINKDINKRISQEKMTLSKMIHIYCKNHHKDNCEYICPECKQLLEYALTRIQRCPLIENKPTCKRCHIHCYAKKEKDLIKGVMRYAGPRMIFYHPIIAIRHIIREIGTHK